MRRSVHQSYLASIGWARIVGLMVPLAILGTSVGAARAQPTVASLPRGVVGASFTDSVVGSISSPTTVVGLPDGRAVVLAKGGTVRIVSGGAVLPTAALTRTVCSDSEQGMLGFAIDPNFGDNGYVYLYYTRPNAFAPGGCVNRASRFTMTGNTINSGSETVLVDNIASEAGNHNGGDLEVGNDGYLYISVGDGGCNPRNSGQCAGANPAAQDLSLLNGKILRVDRNTGFAAPGNPYTAIAGTADCRVRGNAPSTPTTICKELFAWGLRNPWRFAFDTNTGATRFYINDVGQNTREEVNLGAVGANYGWPNREGQCAQGQNPLCAPPASNLGYTQPFTDYPHNPANGGDYITGGAFVPNGAWSKEYDGGYLFADGDPGKIFFRSAAGSTNYNTSWASDLAGISDLNFVLEPTGWALYYVQVGSTNNVRKITYNASSAVLPGALSYAPLGTPSRVYDTRNLAANSGPMRAGSTRLVPVVGGGAGSVRSALVNVTMILPKGPGYLAAWTPRTPRPFTSVVNAPSAAVVANASVVPVDADGNVVVMASVTADVTVDVLGYFSASASAVGAGRFVGVSPVRAVDTRQPVTVDNDFTLTPGSGQKILGVSLATRFRVPSAASAVVLNITALAGTSSGGYAVAYPSGTTPPTTANVNVIGGDVRANLVVVRMSASGDVDVLMRSGVTNLLIDVLGYFTDSSAAVSSAGLFVPIVPTREVDTRIGVGFPRLSSGETRTINPGSVPDNVAGIVQNLAAVQTGGAGYFTSFAAGTNPPNVSNGNVTAAGQTRSVLAFTDLGDGFVSYYTFTATDFVVDVAGYFTG